MHQGPGADAARRARGDAEQADERPTETWIGPAPCLTEEDAIDHLSAALPVPGQATSNEIASWAGMRVGDITPVLGRLDLRRFRAPRTPRSSSTCPTSRPDRGRRRPRPLPRDVGGPPPGARPPGRDPSEDRHGDADVAPGTPPVGGARVLTRSRPSVAPDRPGERPGREAAVRSSPPGGTMGSWCSATLRGQPGTVRAGRPVSTASPRPGACRAPRTDAPWSCRSPARCCGLIRTPPASRCCFYLLINMAPFTLLAPLIGPAIDRFRFGHR